MKRISLGVVAVLAFACATAWAQQKIDMKLAYFVGDQHAMSQWLIKWSDSLEKQSGGRLAVKRFPGSQMGPVQQHYDFARTGQADVALAGINPTMRQAILAIEDNRFYSHGALDFKGTIRAFINNATSRTTQGGSSITQQLVKLILVQQARTQE